MITIEEYVQENFGNLFKIEKKLGEDGLRMFITHPESGLEIYEIILNDSGKYFSVKATLESFCLLAVFPPYILEQLKQLQDNIVKGLFDPQLHLELSN